MRPPLEITINGARGDEWQRVCGTRQFPVTTWEPIKADLPGKPQADVYLLNLLLVESVTLAKITAHLAQKFGLSEAEANAEAIKGIPILAEDCTVVLNDPQRWVGCGPKEELDYDDDEYWDDSDEFEDEFEDCGMLPDGTCMKAGSEECDWECPFS